MSKVFKSVGKIFKKVVKVAVKIAPFALAAAAVVFTGGAALGILPSFSAAVGGVVAHLGLSAAVTGALTGAVTSAGFGAALGFVTGGKKGMQKGALMGALTGGALGAFNPGAFGITKTADGLVTTSHALASQAANAANAAKGIAPTSLGAQPLQQITGHSLDSAVASLPDMANPGLGQAVSSVGNGIAPVSGEIAHPAVAATLPSYDPTQYMEATSPSLKAAQGIEAIQGTSGGVGGMPASGGGILDFINKNPTMIGSVLQAIGGGSKVSSKDLEKQVKAEVELRSKLGTLAYGGVYSGNSNAFGIGGNYQIPEPRYYYDPQAKTVVDRQGG